MPPANDRLALLAPALFVLIWATGFVVARLVAPYADPLPQALVLTALVIAFGMTALVVLLVMVVMLKPRVSEVMRRAVRASSGTTPHVDSLRE
jgi:multisubunit Na+/H+ antiporter MnhC subunit